MDNIGLIIGIVNAILIVILLIRNEMNNAAFKRELNLQLTTQYDKLKAEYNNGYDNGYDTGYKKGASDSIKAQGFEVRIFPWKEDITEGIWKKRHSLQIGYQYQLFVNGVPCLQPHVQIHETIVLDKLDKEDIDIAVGGLQNIISSLANIHPAIKSAGDFANYANGLLALKKNSN
jgi:hypothetical protein